MDLQTVLSEINARLEADPTGGLAEEYIVQQKSMGLLKDQAHEILRQLYVKYRDQPVPTAVSEQILDSIGELLDAIHGNCGSPGWIYPKGE